MVLLEANPSDSQTRRIAIPIDSRYRLTKLYQVTDDLARRGQTQGRRISEQNRVSNLPSSLGNLVTKRLNVFVWGVWNPPAFPESSDDIIYTLTGEDVGRLDRLAFRFYGNPNFWWVLAHVNKIKDPLKRLVPGTRLRIPTYDTVIGQTLSTQLTNTRVLGTT